MLTIVKRRVEMCINLGFVSGFCRNAGTGPLSEEMRAQPSFLIFQLFTMEPEEDSARGS